MNKISNKIFAVILAAVMLFSLASCMNKNNVQNDGNTSSQEQVQLWDGAVYKEDAEIGEGNITVKVEVKAEDKAVTLTVHTDKDILGDALLENKLIEGDLGEYGLFVKKVNGITADYDVDKSYWAFYKDGEYMNSGVDGAKITDGEHYELVYTK